MASSNTSSKDISRTGTPNPPQSSRFTTSASTAEDLLKSQTVGLVNLNDFRKRRAEAVEAKELGFFQNNGAPGATTSSEGTVTPQLPVKKKKKGNKAKGKLSFAVEDEEGEDTPDVSTKDSTPGPGSPAAVAASLEDDNQPVVKKKLGANSKIGLAPKVKTKSALLKEAQTREQLRKEFLAIQELVKNSEILVPFVFYDGTNLPGGVCKVKKGDPIWLFLDRSRKVGAELGVGSDGSKSKREWARVGVDDLMLVKGEIIIPHHYEFYYFIVNKTTGPSNDVLFPYSSEPPSVPASSTPEPTDLSNYDPLARPQKKPTTVTEIDADLEGKGHDPSLTKVVDRRWYERNKHIFPASTWEEFDPTRDYTKGLRKDAEGNVFFFSS